MLHHERVVRQGTQQRDRSLPVASAKLCERVDIRSCKGDKIRNLPLQASLSRTSPPQTIASVVRSMFTNLLLVRVDLSKLKCEYNSAGGRTIDITF